MLCDRIVAGAGPNSGDSPRIDDYLDVGWWEFAQRAFRKATRGGRDIRVLLPLGTGIRHGDLLSDAGGEVRIQVYVAPCELLIIHPRDSNEMGLLALEIGNLHIPAEIMDGTVRVVADGLAEAVVADLGLPCERQLARFHPRRCAGMPKLRVSAEFRVIGP